MSSALYPMRFDPVPESSPAAAAGDLMRPYLRGGGSPEAPVANAASCWLMRPGTEDGMQIAAGPLAGESLTSIIQKLIVFILVAREEEESAIPGPDDITHVEGQLGELPGLSSCGGSHEELTLL